MNGEILSEETRLALEELCERCGLPESVVHAYVEEGVIEAEGADAVHWRFSEVSLVRVQKARRLERDLGVNTAGAALALDLLDEVETLKKELDRLRRGGS